jgi:hypothetical protein
MMGFLFCPRRLSPSRLSIPLVPFRLRPQLPDRASQLTV